MDSRDQYDYGWNDKGQRFHALKPGRREGRVNMIAAWCNQNLIAPFTIEGACNRTVERNLAGKLFTSYTHNWTGCGDG
ncbi:MAG: transposase [Aphanothece sp. CMT-3BRIN-NPC111]|nr:transposase [Aphanothece sp. CMT-3BRIN-NPC111]